MKKRNFLLALLSCLLIVVFLTGCFDSIPFFGTESSESTSSTSSGPVTKTEYNKAQNKYVYFEKSTDPRELYVPVEEIMAYETKYPECNGTFFKDQFSGENLCIYNSYMYAMENSYTYFCVYVEDNKKSFDHIRKAFCMDTPFMEQNKSWYGEGSSPNPINRFGKSVSFSVEQFTVERWEKKMQALEECRRIVNEIPKEYNTQLEKMEYLYRYVRDNVEYVAYESMADNDYLYDAVCNKKTVCDGYSNMLNLLFNLIGVECCEAAGSNIESFETATPEEKENPGGHTWVVAKIGDKFYNFDPTFEDGASSVNGGKKLFYFGYSDELVSVKYLDCEKRRPKCTDNSRDFQFADITVNSVYGAENIKNVAQLIDNNTKSGKYETVIAIKHATTDAEYRTFFNNILPKLNYGSYFRTEWFSPNKNTLVAIFRVTP